MNKKTAIILVNWNGFYHSDNCITSIFQSNATDYDIIVVDNNSEDISGSKLKEKYPGIILIESKHNAGFSGGNNIGLQYSVKNGYQYSFLLNNDTFVQKDFLYELTRFMDTHSDFAVAQPKIFFADQRNILWNGGSYYNKLFGITYSKRYGRKETKEQNRIQIVDWVTGCAFFVRNEILKQTGLLVENMFMYYEDAELSFRIKSIGYQLAFLPQSVIYHVAGASGKTSVKLDEGYTSPDILYYSLRNRIWFLKKYTPFYCIPAVLTYNICYYTSILLYFFLRRRFKKFKATINAIQYGFKGMIETPVIVK